MTQRGEVVHLASWTWGGRMKRWLLGETPLRARCRRGRWPFGPLADLALCVDGYARHGGGPAAMAPWAEPLRDRLAAGAPLAPIPAQDLLDLLFYLQRADRMAGAGALHLDPVAQVIAQEVRRRVEARERGVPSPTFVLTTSG